MLTPYKKTIDKLLSNCEASLPIEIVTKPSKFFSLSEGQKGLWFLQQKTPELTAYNVPMAIRLKYKVDVNKLTQAASYMLNKHPQLNMCFTLENGVPLQYINKSNELFIDVKTITPSSNQELLSLMTQIISKPFSLDKEQLIRVYLLSLSSNDHILLFNIHHIIFDGTSALIFIRDFF